MKAKKIFISFPYTHSDQNVTNERVQRAREYCLALIKEGYIPFSPALVGHDLIHQLNLNLEEQDMSFKYWDKFCYGYLEGCNELHVLMFDGYDDSVGVAGEIQEADSLKIEVKYIDFK